MELIRRTDLTPESLQGRTVERVIGKGAASPSNKMTMGFAHYAAASGKMEPHQHAEEVLYVLEAKSARFRFGSGAEDLPNVVELEAGMTLHIPELEWHVFDTDADGMADCISFYGQVDNIKPEDILGR